MFAYNYKMDVVDSEKNIVSLRPTLGTYTKAFLPMLVITGGLTVAGLVSSVVDKHRQKSKLTLITTEDK